MSDWKKEYDDCLFNSNLDKVIELKNNNFPNKLFKYRYFDNNNYWMDWVKGRIFADAPLNFNDPFDSLLTYTAESYIDVVRNVCNLILKKYNIKLKNIDRNRLKLSNDPVQTICTILENHGHHADMSMIDESIYDHKNFEDSLRQDLRLACFSEIYNSILMWSHYAMNHEGFCIEYDFTQDNFMRNLIFPVTYSFQRRVISQPPTNNGWVATTALCKSPEWSYEKEWRFLNGDRLKEDGINTSSGKYFVDAPDSIKAVYVGAKIKTENLNALMQLTSNHQIPVHQMKIDDEEYKLISTLIL